jgi:hypothetical protein
MEINRGGDSAFCFGAGDFFFAEELETCTFSNSVGSMDSSAKVWIVWGVPSSYSLKSLALRSVTGFPDLSVTAAFTITAFTLTPNVELDESSFFEFLFFGKRLMQKQIRTSNPAKPKQRRRRHAAFGNFLASSGKLDDSSYIPD